MVGQYPKAVSGDVFNEIVEEKAKFRNTYLIRKFGFKFIDFCFRVAHEAAPNAKLVINDYHLECAGQWCSSKRRNMLAVLDELQRMRTPIHAFGIQGHLSSEFPPSPSKTAAFIDAIVDRALDAFLSEFEV